MVKRVGKTDVMIQGPGQGQTIMDKHLGLQKVSSGMVITEQNKQQEVYIARENNI